MNEPNKLTFVRLSDGTVLQRQADGGFQPVPTLTDFARLAQLTEDEIEAMAASDPDHPGTDDALLESAARVSTDTVEIDPDVLDFFKRDGRADAEGINTVLRRYVETQRKAG
jgi:uncharacterized protein (DUF4415 family)